MEDLVSQKKSSKAPVVTLVIGLVIGLVLGILAPKFLGDRLPAAVGGGGGESFVTGIVRAKRADADRLLLTVESAEGATLATFREKIEEIGLLVDVGDTLTFELKRYRPFIDDPRIAGVKKAGGRGGTAPPPPAPPGVKEDDAGPVAGDPEDSFDDTPRAARDTTTSS